MYTRTIQPFLNDALRHYDIVTLLGPRQSGKSTLVKMLFKDFSYVSLEDPDKRLMALNDPRSFLNGLGKKCIIDELQRAPILTSYIQTIVDEERNKFKFVLTGSNGLMLMESINQSLAGRTEIFELLPLSVSEIFQKNTSTELEDLILNGGYPKIHHEKLNAHRWLKNYFQLYIEKDIRQISNITNLDLFERFMRLAAGRVGQLINSSSFAGDVGVSAPTINSWIAALKSTYIAFSLRPHFANFNKRIIKTPKLYFYDTGLLCYLLGIQTKEQLNIHPLKGNIFENFIVSELHKKKYNNAEEINYYFWRDQKGHEVDLVEDKSVYLFPIEIKLGQTFNEEFIKNIQYLNDLQTSVSKTPSLKLKENEMGLLVYTGETCESYKGIMLKNWRQLLAP